MAQKRMLDKKISVSEQIANLKKDGQLIYTWAIPHSDDVGLLPRSHRSLKAMIIPLVEITMDEFDSAINDIIGQGLWREFEWQGDKFYQIMNFTKYQLLRKNRQPQTALKIALDKDPKKTWKVLEEIVGFTLDETDFDVDNSVDNPVDKYVDNSVVNQRSANGQPMVSQRLSEEKGSEEKRSEWSRREREKNLPPSHEGAKEKISIFSLPNKIKKISTKSPDPEVEKCISYLKEFLGGTLDGTILENRQYCFLLLGKLKKDFPKEDPVVLIKLLIVKGIEKDPFIGKNITNFKYLYYNTQKVILSIKLADLIAQKNKKGGCANLDDFLKNNPKT